MISTTRTSTPPAPHPGPGGRDARRRRHLTAVAAVVFAFIVAGAALLASVGSLTWGAPATAPRSEPPLPTATPVASTDADAEADGITTDADGTTDEDDTSDEDGTTDEGGTTDDEGVNGDHGSDQDADTHDPAAGDPAADGAGADEPSTDGGAQGRAREDDGAEHDGAEHEDAEHDDAEHDEPQLDVMQVQERLREHRFLVGPADGTAGQQTLAAVMAYQRVNGLAVDGVVGPATSAALRQGSAEPTLAGGPAERIEVDLDAQLLHVVEGGERIATMQVSSGSGGTYETANGGTARSVTPVGSFTVERRIHGVRNAPLGTLYDPLYFHRGFAIHGSPSVPAYPASHGCIRVSKADAAWLIDRIPDGMPVQLYGGTHVFTP